MPDNNRGDGTERDNGSASLHREPSRPTDPWGEPDPSLLVKLGLFVDELLVVIYVEL